MNRPYLFALILCIASISLHAQIGTGTCDAEILGDTSTATISNFSIASGTNRVLVVNGFAAGITMESDFSITYNGQNFTPYFFGGSSFVQYLVLGTGVTIISDLTIVVNIGTVDLLSLQAMSFAGVEQSTPITDDDAAGGGGTGTFSATVNSQADDLVAAFSGYTAFGTTPPGVTVGAGQTEICAEDFTYTSAFGGGGDLSSRSSISTKPGASPTVTCEFTVSTATPLGGSIMVLNMQYDGTTVSLPNAFNGNGNGTDWDDSANWSYGTVPVQGNDVLIPAGQNVVVPSGVTGSGSTIEVEVGATLETQANGELDIENQ